MDGYSGDLICDLFGGDAGLVSHLSRCPGCIQSGREPLFVAVLVVYKNYYYIAATTEAAELYYNCRSMLH